MCELKNAANHFIIKGKRKNLQKVFPHAEVGCFVMIVQTIPEVILKREQYLISTIQDEF